MNIRKPVDYSAMFTALDKLVAAELPQMKLYCEIGRLVSGRQEKGAAVAASEYLSRTHPDVPGFSPRNLRRMRDFYRAYENAPEVLTQAVSIGWTQNEVILEAELTVQERTWYIRAVRRFGWSKLELQKQIAADAHKENGLDFGREMCYTEGKSDPEEVPGKAGFHTTKSEFVDAPLIDELAMAVECRLVSYDPQTGHLVGEIINVSMDENVLTSDGKVDVAKLAPIVFDPVNAAYYKLGEKVGNAFSDGQKLKG